MHCYFITPFVEHLAGPSCPKAPDPCRTWTRPGPWAASSNWQSIWLASRRFSVQIRGCPRSGTGALSFLALTRAACSVQDDVCVHGFTRVRGMKADRYPSLGCGPVWLGHLSWEQVIAGSNPATP